LLSGVNVKTGELFPATFPDKGPDQALRSARHLTGGQQVILSELCCSFLLVVIISFSTDEKISLMLQNSSQP